MTLDSVDLLATYGWKLSYVDGHLDQPARKKILKVQGYQTKDMVFDARRITVILIQKFANKDEIFDAVTAIHDLLQYNAIHTVDITEHGITAFSAVAREGANITINRLSVTVRITFTEVTI